MRRSILALAAGTLLLLLGGCVGPHLGDTNGWSDSQKREFEQILVHDSYASLCQLSPLYQQYLRTRDTEILSKILVGYSENLANSCIDIPAYKAIEKELNKRKIHTRFEFSTRSVSASAVMSALRSGESIKGILQPYMPANPQFERLLAYYRSSEAPAASHSKLFMSLQRAKVMSDEGWETYFLVNIPEFKVRFFENGSQRFAFPVVVGKKNWQTPIFTAAMKYVVLNPTWYVPDNIARAEEIPHLLRDKNYLSASTWWYARSTMSTPKRSTPEVSTGENTSAPNTKRSASPTSWYSSPDPATPSGA